MPRPTTLTITIADLPPGEVIPRLAHEFRVRLGEDQEPAAPALGCANPYTNRDSNLCRPLLAGRLPASAHTRRATGLSPSRASSSHHRSTSLSGWPRRNSAMRPLCIESLRFKVDGPVEPDGPFHGRWVGRPSLASADDAPSQVGEVSERVVGQRLPNPHPERLDRLQFRRAGGRTCSRTSPGTARRLARCHPALSTTRTTILVRPGSARVANASRASAMCSVFTRGRITVNVPPVAGRAIIYTKALELGPAARPRSASLAPPHPARDGLQSEPRLVFGPHLDGLPGVRRPHAPYRSS